MGLGWRSLSWARDFGCSRRVVWGLPRDVTAGEHGGCVHPSFIAWQSQLEEGAGLVPQGERTWGQQCWALGHITL